MAYSIFLDDIVIKEDLPSIPKANKEQIKKAIAERLATNPVEHGKPLRHKLKGYLKMRVGDWRVIYKVKESRVAIYAIGIRRDIYKFASSRFRL